MSTTLSSVTYTADGVETQFVVTFGYLLRSHVHVFVDNELASFQWVNGTRVQLNLAPDIGQQVRIQRVTDNSQLLVEFFEGSTLLSDDLNVSDLQLFYLIQELAEGLVTGVGGGTVPSDPSGYATEAWVTDQLLNLTAFENTQAYIDLLQRIIDEEVARAQAIADEASARATAISDEAAARAAAVATETAARAQAVLDLQQADLAAGQRLDALEATAFNGVDLTALEASIASLQTVTTDLQNNKAEASDVTALQAELDNPTTGLKARATAVEDRVTTVENDKANASDVAALDVAINDPTTGLEARAGSLEQRTTDLENGGAASAALDALTARVDTNEAAITAETQARTTEDTSLAQDVASLTSRTDAAEASITNLDQAVTAETGARTLAVTDLNTRVGDVEVDITDVQQTLNANNQARIDDIAVLTTATANAQADATQALSLVATESSTRASEISSLQTNFQAADANLQDAIVIAQSRADDAYLLASTPGGSSAVALESIRATLDHLGGNAILNPTFELGFAEWSWWDTNPSRVEAFQHYAVANPLRSDLKAYRTRRTSGQPQCAMYQRRPYPGLQNRKFRVRVSMQPQSGTVEGSGVFVQFRTSSGTLVGGTQTLSFSTEPDTDGTVAASRSGVATFEKTFDAPSVCDEVWVYCGVQSTLFSGYSSTRDITIDWLEISCRPIEGAVADVSFLRESLATNNGSRARVFLGVNTANNEATLEAFASEGDGVWDGSKIKFTATSFEFSGDVIIDGTITADNLANGAASNGVGDVVTSQLEPSNNTWTTVASCTLETVGGKVYLHGSCDLNCYANENQSGVPYAEARLLRGSTQIRIRNAGGYWTAVPQSGGGTAFAMVGYGDIQDLDDPPAGTHTYSYQVRLFNGNNGLGYRRVRNRVLTAIEFRR